MRIPSLTPVTRFLAATRYAASAFATAMVMSTVLVGSAAAQSAQKYALQFAVLGTAIDLGGNEGAISGVGFEPQLRFNRLYSTEAFAMSLGLGAQYTKHADGLDELSIAGAFIEPRIVPVIGSSRFFPYLAGRLALLQQSSNFGSASSGYAFGGGAGMVIKLTKTINLDAGAALVRQKFGDFTFNDGGAGAFRPFTTYAAKAGINIGFPR